MLLRSVTGLRLMIREFVVELVERVTYALLLVYEELLDNRILHILLSTQEGFYP